MGRILPRSVPPACDAVRQGDSNPATTRAEFTLG